MSTATTVTVTDLDRTRAAAGARHLDEHRPGWADRIDVDRLDLGDAYACIIGQLTGSFWSAEAHALSGFDDSSFERERRYGTAIARGFWIRPEWPEGRTYTEVNAAMVEAWRSEVESRRTH